MRNFGRFGCVIAVSAFLTGCGAVGGRCSSVEMDTQVERFGNTNVTLRNTSGEPKLVTLAVVMKSDGAEIHSETVRVDAKDVAQANVGTMDDELRLDMSCA